MVFDNFHGFVIKLHHTESSGFLSCWKENVSALNLTKTKSTFGDQKSFCPENHQLSLSASAHRS